MKYYFPIHLDAGNRGCEAIARGSALLVDKPAQRIFGYSRNVDLDTQMGLAEYITLVPCRRESLVVDKFLAVVNKLFHTNRTKAWRQIYPYRSFLRRITKDDVVLFTGGDMLCYDDNEVIYTNNWLHQRGIRTVLWGCSMGPENQTKEKLKTLSKFSLIYTRESLTYEYFSSLGLKNVCHLPDPAFILQEQPFPLPTYLINNNVVGLNISNFVMGGMTLDSAFGQEVLSLIDYILKETSYHLLLIPHVTWNIGGVNQDDRQMACLISKRVGRPDRLHILDIDGLNYCQIRYAISYCKMFVGARTHAVISAYSTSVPTLALGYSIKSRGIAKDLGLDEQLVVDSKNCSQGTLLRSFSYLAENQEDIHRHLLRIMPEYKQKTYQIREMLNNI
ncbi:MAG: polysaccharide pyruvyl transferase family protein [Bacteroidaceae bacterium]|nr:polysaccharide pyruvyl transferase family protein [Bacteroidaceae bacterium]